MYTFFASNIHTLLESALWSLSLSGIEQESRNGRVLRLPGPVTITHSAPRRYVLVDVSRDANPFFHLVEALWMLAGREDVASLLPYNSNMAKFSDDGRRLNAAYGHRWRRAFGGDQLLDIIGQLSEDRNDRRVVMQVWDYEMDGPHVKSKDKPCNVNIFFEIDHANKLNMTVCNRSNDLIWGALGANAVHMSVLHEFVAGAVGVEPGQYVQFTNNLHVYLDNPQHESLVQNPGLISEFHGFKTTPLGVTPQNYRNFLEACETFFDMRRGPNGRAPGLMSEWWEQFPFFVNVVIPLSDMWHVRRAGADKDTVWDHYARTNHECAWSYAAKFWMEFHGWEKPINTEAINDR